MPSQKKKKRGSRPKQKVTRRKKGLNSVINEVERNTNEEVEKENFVTKKRSRKTKIKIEADD